MASGNQRSLARLRHIYVVPTFSCQLKCHSCYAAKQADHFNGYLSWPSFLRVFDFFGPSLRSVALVGGEPTQWKFIREAILFLQNKGKAVTLFSNGLDYVGVYPNRIIVNGTALIAGDRCSLVSRNLARYRQQSVDIRIRFNVGEDWSERDTERALTAVRRYSASVSISARYPVPRTNTVGSVIFGFARAAVGAGACVSISRCAPRCIFTNEQYHYLARQCGLKSTCPLPSASVVVLPDGWSIQPCVEIPSPYTLADLRTRSARALFRGLVEAIRVNGANKCKDCDHYEARQCGGGCLAYLG